MKKVIVVFLTVLLSVIYASSPTGAFAYDFGDYRSVTLATKAWDALEKGDIEAVLAYTNKCVELYGAQAKKMQTGLKDYATASKEEIFSYWALNDVATCFFIQGEAYRRAKMNDEAKEAFNKIIKEYTYGQCWDTKGWFWKPAEAAKEKLAALESGSNLDFGDYSSETLTTKAWQALNNEDLNAALTYTNKVLELYSDKAKEMQSSLKEYPEDKDKVFSYWALNDVGTSLFIQGEAYRKAGKTKEAQDAYSKVTKEFSFSQCWDPQGWFWKPADAAQKQLEELKQS